MLSAPSNSLSTQQQRRHEFPYLPDYFVTNLGSEGEREMGKTRSREELDRLVGARSSRTDAHAASGPHIKTNGESFPEEATGWGWVDSAERKPSLGATRFHVFSSHPIQTPKSRHGK